MNYRKRTPSDLGKAPTEGPNRGAQKGAITSNTTRADLVDERAAPIRQYILLRKVPGRAPVDTLDESDATFGCGTASVKARLETLNRQYQDGGRALACPWSEDRSATPARLMRS